MLFSGDEVNKPVNVLSGERKYASCFQNSCSWNQMSLYLTIQQITWTWNLFQAWTMDWKTLKESIIFASHDHEFIQTLANHIIVLSKNGVIDRIDENLWWIPRKCRSTSKSQRTLERLNNTLKLSWINQLSFLSFYEVTWKHFSETIGPILFLSSFP